MKEKTHPASVDFIQTLQKMTVKQIEQRYQINKLTGEKKNDYIIRVKHKKLCQEFNARYPKGSVVIYREAKGEDGTQLKYVAGRAFLYYGRASCYLKRPGNNHVTLCSIEPGHIEY